MKRLMLIALILLAGCTKDTPEAKAAREVKVALYESNKARRFVDNIVFVKHEKSGLCFAYAMDSRGHEMFDQVECGIIAIMEGKKK